MLVIILSILLPTFLAMFLIAFWSLFNRQRKVLEKGTLIFKVNQHMRRVYRITHINFNIRYPRIFSSNKNNRWVAWENLFDSFIGTTGEKHFREAYIEMKNNVPEINGQFDTDKIFHHGRMVHFVYGFKWNYKTERYILNLSWKELTRKERLSENTRLKDLRELADMDGRYKLLISFLISNQTNDSLSDFYEVIITDRALKGNKGFALRNRVVSFIFTSNNRSELVKKIKDIEAYLNTRGKVRGINHHTKGVAATLVTNVNSFVRVEEVRKIIQFQVVKSMNQGGVFLDNRDKSILDDPNYTIFTKKLKEFSRLIDEREFSEKRTLVKKVSNQRSIIPLISPSLKTYDPVWEENIIKIDAYKNILRDSFLEEVCFGKLKYDKPFMVDSSADWLIRNQSRLNEVKKGVFIIDFVTKSYFGTADALLSLLAHGITFGFRMFKYNEQFISMIKTLNPKFIIVDKNLIKNMLITTNLNILSLNELSKEYGFKIIFEELDIKSHRSLVNSINVEFYTEVPQLKKVNKK